MSEWMNEREWIKMKSIKVEKGKKKKEEEIRILRRHSQ